MQDPGQTGGDGLRYSYADGKLTITQDSGKVPYVEAKEGFPPRGGNWVGVAVQYTETFEGDLYKLEVTKGETTTTYDQEILSETEQDRNELWYYFDAATTKQVTLKIYFTETDFEEVVIDAKDVTDLETKIEALLNGATGTLVEFTEDENETHLGDADFGFKTTYTNAEEAHDTVLTDALVKADKNVVIEPYYVTDDGTWVSEAKTMTLTVNEEQYLFEEGQRPKLNEEKAVSYYRVKIKSVGGVAVDELTEAVTINFTIDDLAIVGEQGLSLSQLTKAYTVGQVPDIEAPIIESVVVKDSGGNEIEAGGTLSGEVTFVVTARDDKVLKQLNLDIVKDSLKDITDEWGILQQLNVYAIEDDPVQTEVTETILAALGIVVTYEVGETSGTWTIKIDTEAEVPEDYAGYFLKVGPMSSRMT